MALVLINLIDSHPKIAVGFVGGLNSLIGFANGVPGDDLWLTMLQQGGATAVALFAIWVIRMIHKERIDDLKEQATRRREDTAMMQQILGDALKASTATASALSTLSEQLRMTRPRE